MTDLFSPMRLVTIPAAIIPSIVLLYIFYKRDYYPEPRRVLLTTFFLGVLTILPHAGLAFLPEEKPLFALMKNYPEIHPAVPGLYVAFVLAAIPEEFFKFLVLRFYSARHKAFDEPMDGVVYGVAASLGFATLENILFVQLGGWTTAAMRAITAVPAHACFGALMGYFVGQAKFNPKKKHHALLGLFVAILFHGLYDWPLMSRGKNITLWYDDDGVTMYLIATSLFWGAVMTVKALWVFAIVRRLRREQETHAHQTAVQPNVRIPNAETGNL